MKNVKKLLSLALILAVVTTAAFAGGSQNRSGGGSTNSSGQIELRVLNYQDLTAPNVATEIDKIWGAFEKANPDIRIIREDLYNEPFHEKTAAYAASGQVPDVLYVWPAGRSSTLHTQKLLKDLSPLVQKDGLGSLYTKAALDGSAQGGGYLAMLPMTVTSSHAFYVNTEVLQANGLQPAKTYAELKAQVAVLKAKGIETVIMDNASDWVMQSCLFSTVIGRFAGADWEKRILSGQAKFTDADFVAALQFIKTIYDDGVINPAISLSAAYGDGIGKFANGKGAYFIDGDWRAAAFITDKTTGQAVIPVARQGNFPITVFPDIPGAKLNKSTSTTLGTGWAISAAVPAGSAKEEAAWRLVKWLVGTETQALRMESGGITVPVVTNIDISKLAMEPIQVAIGNLPSQYTTGTAVFDSALDASIATVANIGLQEIGMGSKTPARVAQEIQAAYDAWKAKQ
jgi:raffinose/stachyose/melibiose transport system substrate-binding protein